MASALHTKINSYAIQRGFEYADNPITVNPARTGTNTLNTAHTFSTPPPIYVNDGPAGGNGCVEVVVPVGIEFNLIQIPKPYKPSQIF